MNSVVGSKQKILLSRLSGNEEAARLVMGVLSTARCIDSACADLLEKYDLSEGRFAALLAISDEPGIRPRVLADRLEVTSATVTGLLDRLERDGLIVRSPCSTDRRTYRLNVAASGEQVLSRLVPLYSRWLHQIGAGVTESQRESATLAFTTMQQNVTLEFSQ